MRSNVGCGINCSMTAGVVLILLAATGCSSLKTKPAEGVQLSGAWQLNESLSDDPFAMSRAGSRPWGGGGRGMHGPGGMGGGGMGGMGHGGGHMGGGGRGAHSGSGSSMAAQEQPQKLSIDQSATELKLVADGSPTDFLYGQKVVTSFGSGVADSTSGWKGDQFVVTLKVKNGPTITRNYEAVDNGHQLIVETTTSGGRGPERKFRSVYERAGASAAATVKP